MSEIPGNPRVLERLGELLESGQAIALVGAGASAGLYPLWEQLIRRLADETVARGLAKAEDRDFWLRIASQRPQQVVRGIKQALGDSIYGIVLREIFRPTAGPDGYRYTPIDDAMAETGQFYARFMDDWVVLAPTRWKLRTAIRTVNKTLAQLKVGQHPDKTFIGRISQGFDLLGCRFTSAELVGIARQSVERFVERATRLHGRGADIDRIGTYVRGWFRWVGSGLGSFCLSPSGCSVPLKTAGIP